MRNKVYLEKVEKVVKGLPVHLSTSDLLHVLEKPDNLIMLHIEISLEIRLLPEEFQDSINDVVNHNFKVLHNNLIAIQN